MQIIQDIPVVKNEATYQYEMQIEDHTALIAYSQEGSVVTLIHTEVPKELEGKGIGRVLVEKTLQQIEQAGQTLVAQCPFVASYIKRHPDWMRIVDKSAMS